MDSKKSESPIDAIPTRDGPHTFVRISEDQVGKFQVGDKLSVILSGTIHSMRDASNSDEPHKMYDVELAAPQISSVAMNAADFEMKQMMEG